MHDLLIAVWGAVTVILAAAAISYGVRVKEAEDRRDKAEELATDAIGRCNTYEQEFVKAKDFFEKAMSRPVTATMTDEQVENISKHIGARLLPYTSRLGTPQ